MQRKSASTAVSKSPNRMPKSRATGSGPNCNSHSNKPKPAKADFGYSKDRCPAAVRRVSSSTHDFYSQILAQGFGVLLDRRQTHVFGVILDSRNCGLLSSQSPCDVI